MTDQNTLKNFERNLTMKMALDCVEYFQKKLGIYEDHTFATKKIQHFLKVAAELSDVGEDFYKSTSKEDSGQRWLHSSLMINVMADFLNSMGEGNETSAFKTLTEMLYVLLGVATHYEWPLIDAFAILNREKMQAWQPEIEPVENEQRETIETVLKKFRSGSLAARYAGNIYEQIHLQFMKRSASDQTEIARLKKELAHEQKRSDQSGEESNQGQ